MQLTIPQFFSTCVWIINMEYYICVYSSTAFLQMFYMPHFNKILIFIKILIITIFKNERAVVKK